MEDNLVNFPKGKNPLFNGSIRKELGQIIAGDDSAEGEKKVSQIENELCAHLIKFAKEAGAKFGKLLVDTVKDVLSKGDNNEQR